MKRLEYVDILKGLGILFMIMGHIGFGGKFDYYIHAFNMPLFFFVSGFFLKVTDTINLKEIIIKKFKTLIIPYLSFGIIHYLLWCILEYNETNKIIMLKNLFFINNDKLPIAGALWFLTALFFSEILFFIIYKYIKSEKCKTIVIICITLVGVYSSIIFDFKLPYSLDASFVGLGILYIGYTIRRYKESNKAIQNIMNMPIYLCVILLAINMFLCFKNGYVNMRTGNYGNVIMFWINSISAIIIYWNISLYISSNKIYNYFSKIFKYIGKNSIVFVCLNQLVILFVVKLMGVIFKMTQVSLVRSIIVLIITTIILCISSILINSTRLRILIGKRKTIG